MHERSGGGAPPDTGPLFPVRTAGALFLLIISERKEAKKIYFPESNRLPLGSPLSALHRTCPPEKALHRVPQGQTGGAEDV